MDWSALVLRPGDPVSAFGRLVRNAVGDWFEGPVPVPLMMTPVVRAPMHAVPVRVAAAQPGEDERLYQDRPPRTLRFHWTRGQTQQVSGHLREQSFEWEVYSHGIIGDHVEARLTRVLPEIAAWAAMLPPGILALDPWLVPATQRDRMAEAVH